MTVVSSIVVALALAAFVASRIDLPYYSVAPGTAQPVAPLIRVPPDRSHPIVGKLLLTDVLLARVNALTYLPDRWSGDTQLVPADEVLSPFTPPDQLITQGYLQMAASQSAAATAALRRLGYQVPEHDAGTQIYSVSPSSPADGALKVGEIVKAVDGSPTPDVCAFATALHPHQPGDRVDLTVEQATVTSAGKVVPGPVEHETVRLGKPPRGVSAPACPGITGPARGFLGVEVQTYQTFSYPFKVSVATSDIGGPSAGLAMTLGIIDKLSSGRLTGRAAVAATGTISPDGTVGQVGGVPQKTIAVERAGVTAFLVPQAQYHSAEAEATPGFHVYGVRNLDQALSVLQRLGGKVPPQPAATAPPTAAAAAG